MRATFAPATLAHVEALAPTLRAGDVAEVQALGLSPLEALRQSVESSDEAWALGLDGDLAAVGGVQVLHRATLLGPPESGSVWLLTGAAVERHRVSFAVATKQALRLLLRRYPLLVQAVDARYTAALRWARWLGGEVQPAVPWGPKEMPFHPVFWRSSWA